MFATIRVVALSSGQRDGTMTRLMPPKRMAVVERRWRWAWGISV